jgi:ArsR family transcriptional regulator
LRPIHFHRISAIDDESYLMSSVSITGKLAALSHPARLDILRHLSGADGCACGEVVEKLPLAQSTVSQHLKVLLEAGLVTFERNSQRSSYRINRQALEGVSRELKQIVDQCCAEPCCGDSCCPPQEN